MSIASEISRIAGNVSDSLTAVSNKGVTVPAGSNSDDLAGLIAQIQQGSGSAVVVTEEPDTGGGVIKNITAVDISNDTVDAAHLLYGYTAHDHTGTAITGSYVAPTARTSDDITVSGATVTVPAGAYASQATKTVASGTAGTPTAAKGTVSNHSVSVTPSVTNTTGYITGSTKTGTAVTVSASELVSGSETKTANGTYDVTNLAQLVVNVPTGSSKNVQVNSNYYTRTANSYGATNLTLTVAKTGTYNISWQAWRSSSSGTMGTNLHIGSTTGTNQTTWLNTYGQHITLTNQSLTQGTVLTLYATSGSNSRTIGVGNLIIEEQ